MGLDVIAYRQIKKIDCVFDADGEPIDPTTRKPLDGEFVQFYVNSDFPGRANEIDSRAPYLYADAAHTFSGGYGLYNAWREELARLAGYAAQPVDRFKTGNVEMRHDQSAFQDQQGPFWELICFSDCEGVIGAEIARKLANDFAQYDEKAKTIGGYFYQTYQKWRNGFEMASDGGAVAFH